MSYQTQLQKKPADAGSLFVESLRELIGSGKYRLVNHSRIGVRLERRVEDQKKTFCPITAVCFERTGVYITPRNFVEAAELIGLHPAIAAKVARTNDALSNIVIGSLPHLLAKTITT